MAREISTQQTALSGATLYATLDSGGLRWNGTAFEAVLLADWSTYAVALSEATGTGYFTANQPGGIAAGMPLAVTIYKRVGGSPAASDPVVGAGAIGKVAATVAIGDDADAASVKATLASLVDFTAAAVTSTTLTLASTDPAKATSQVGNRIFITGGTLGVGQTGVVTASNTSTGVQTIAGGWSASITPTGTVTYEIFPPAASGGGSGSGQTGDVYAILNPLIASGAFTGASLANVPRSGYSLSSTGLDSISITPAANGVTPNFRQMVVATWRRWFRKHTASGTTLTGYADDGTTVLTTQSIPAVESPQTQGPSA